MPVRFKAVLKNIFYKRNQSSFLVLPEQFKQDASNYFVVVIYCERKVNYGGR